MTTLARIALLAAFAATVSLALATVSGAGAAASLCTGSMLDGTFRAVPGSAGAGNIVYRLRVQNRSTAECAVTGLPGLRLLGSRGRKLPTHASFNGRPGTLTAVLVPLSPGGTATLTARFSPDVPGPGEAVVGGPCEQKAYKLRVAPSGGGSVVVPIAPATPVCEHGALELSAFTRS